MHWNEKVAVIDELQYNLWIHRKTLQAINMKCISRPNIGIGRQILLTFVALDWYFFVRSSDSSNKNRPFRLHFKRGVNKKKNQSFKNHHHFFFKFITQKTRQNIFRKHIQNDTFDLKGFSLFAFIIQSTLHR